MNDENNYEDRQMEELLRQLNQEEMQREQNRRSDRRSRESRDQGNNRRWEQDENRAEDRIRKNQKKNPLREVLSFIIYAAVIVGCTFLIITFVGQRTKVSGNSMYDTLENGDNLILEKVSYRFHDPERFDIVVFKYTHKENTFYIKRIIGLPGETVQIIGSDIYINGELLEEGYGYEPIQDAKRASEPITLGEDEYFVLGDNRNDSSDSRDISVGNVKRSQIVGRAWLRIWPLNKFGFIDHRS